MAPWMGVYMVSEARKRANRKYDKANMVQRVVRFSPREKDLLDHLDAQPNKAGYLKSLIRADMEGTKMTKGKRYSFETANMGTCTIELVSDYDDGTHDVAVDCGSLYREFAECDGGFADEIFEWLVDNGVRFESFRSLWFNYHYAASMIDGDLDQDRLINRAASLSDDELSNWKDMRFEGSDVTE